MSIYNPESIDMWENRPAQIEEVNQVIYNHKGWDEWYCFDTADLLAQQSSKKASWGYYNSDDPAKSLLGSPTHDTSENKCYTLDSNIVDLRYDFLVVNTESFYENDSDGFVNWSKSGITYTFNVRNTLWDGTVHVYKSLSPELLDDTVDLWIEGNTVVVTIRGSQSRSIRVCFHMTQVGEGREMSGIQLVNEEEYTDKFNQQVMHKGYVYNTLTDKGMESVEVTLKPCNEKGQVVDEGIRKTSTLTSTSTDLSTYDGETLTRTVGDKTEILVEKGKRYAGIFTLAYSEVASPGTYYVLLTATYTATIDGEKQTYTSIQVVKVNKIQDRTREICWEKEYNAIKGARKEFTVKIHLLNEYGLVDDQEQKQLDKMEATVVLFRSNEVYSEQSTTLNSKGYMTFKLDFRLYYEDTAKVRIILHAKDGLSTVSSEKEIKLEYFMSNDFKEIREECADGDGADYILIKEKGSTTEATDKKVSVVHTGNDPIQINRNQTIAGMKPDETQGTLDGWATFEGKEKNIFKVRHGTSFDSPTVCKFIGLKFIHGRRAILTEKYTNVTITKCYFTENDNGDKHSGVCVYNNYYTTENGVTKNEQDTLKEHSNDDLEKKNYFVTVIQDSYFYNNVGNCIYSLGKTDIYRNLFRTNSYNCLQQPEPKIVVVDAGTVTYDYNKSHVKVTEWYPQSHSWAKATCYVNKYGIFNGRGPSMLKNDDALPLFSFNSDYHNEAYTYAIYYYDPTDKNLVCYPSDGGKFSKGGYYNGRNRERSATGHGSYGTNPEVNQWMGGEQKTWVYYDGYLFNYWNDGANLYNTHDPWTEEELSIPPNGGIYNPKTKKFDSGYSPQTDNSNKQTSLEANQESIIDAVDSADYLYDG